MTPPHLLVVHDQPSVRHLVADSLARDDVRVSFATSGKEGLSLLEKERVHVLLADLDTAGVGDEFVRRAASIQPLLGVVLIADASRAARPSQPAQPGPIQYLPKPVMADALRPAIHGALERQAGRGRSCAEQGELPPLPASDRPEAPDGQGWMIAASKAMREILQLVRRCAPTDVSVLICGEPDTGKELIAREIHRRSRRAEGPFVHVACGALRESELSERLFAHRQERSDRGGQAPLTLLEKAHGGTLFLENVSQLPPWAQVKLLDVLQQGKCFRPGSNQTGAVDVRVIASTAADLRNAAAQRVFSSSLYHYLSIVQIYVPPLRHRPQDVRPLAEMYLAMANSMRAHQGAAVPCRLGEDAMQCLLEYDWPGNTLQLANAVTHAVLLADQEQITRKEIAESIGQLAPQAESDTIAVPLAGGLKQMERAIIEAVIERCRGNKAAAARSLKLHRRTLYRMLQEDKDPEANRPRPLPLVLGPGRQDHVATPTAGGGT